MKAVANKNFLQPNGFLVSIARLPHISFFCSSVAIPGLSVANPEYKTPFSKLPVPSDVINFEQLTVTFNVDESMQSWIELVRWMNGFAFPEIHEQFSKGISDPDGSNPGDTNTFYSDISIIVLSSHKNPIVEFTYHNCIPTSIGTIDMTVSDSDVNPIQSTVTFDYSHFNIKYPGSTDLLTY